MFAVNHNLAANNVANTLSSHYGKLMTSTQRLSSGLRINSAADDAAGLAIRELQRAEIAALHQGARNANDAISMIQTVDGALAVIDEKLIRMKELAEQAATGTYNSTQRLMIDSEFQAMASEINRIARATDFNGIKLLDGKGLNEEKLNGAAGIAAHAAGRSQTGTDGKIYNATVAVSGLPPGVSSTTTADQILAGLGDLQALGPGTHTISLSNNNVFKRNDLIFKFDVAVESDAFEQKNLQLSFDENNAGNGVMGWDILGLTPNLDYDVRKNPGGSGFMFTGNTPGYEAFFVSISKEDGSLATDAEITAALAGNPINWQPSAKTRPSFSATVTNQNGGPTSANVTATMPLGSRTLTVSTDLGNGNVITQDFSLVSGLPADLTDVSYTINVTATDPPPGPGPNPPGPGPNPPGPGPNNPGGGNNGGGGGQPGSIPDLFTDKVKIHFGPGNDEAEDYYYIHKHDATTNGLGLEDVDIQTQEKAQQALVKINEAIVAKDKIRAEYGAMQNRLENTLANINIQAENLQAAESRISDVDVATEMTNFVRNQILTQSAVAMLSQANSTPQMAMRLIGG